jgi:hypothetical protein
VCRNDGMANEIAGFGDLNLFIFLVVLSELIVKMFNRV